MRACQWGKWAVLTGWHSMYWWHDPWQSVRGMAERMKVLHTLQFSPHLSGTVKCPPSLPSSLHYRQVIFLRFTHAWALSSFILLKFSSSLPFLFLAFSQYTDFFLLADSCEHHPRPLYQAFAFSETASSWKCGVPWHGFSHSRAGIILAGQKDLSYSEASPNCAPRTWNNNWKEFIDACIVK